MYNRFRELPHHTIVRVSGPTPEIKAVARAYTKKSRTKAGARAQIVSVIGHNGFGTRMMWHRPQTNAEKPFRTVFTEGLFGPEGCGISTYALTRGKQDPGKYYRISNRNLINEYFFNRYAGETTLIIDGFYDGCMNIDFLLAVLSPDRVQIDTDTGYCTAEWEQVIITTSQRTFCPDESITNKQLLDKLVDDFVNCYQKPALSSVLQQLRSMEWLSQFETPEEALKALNA